MLSSHECGAWQEAWQYWQQLLEAVDKPAAKKLVKNLDMTNPLGIKHSLGQRRGAKYSKAPLYPFFLETKQKHPTKVLLVRVSHHQLLHFTEQRFELSQNMMVILNYL